MFAGDSGVAGQQAFPVTSTVNESSIAGRPVELDSQGRLVYFEARPPQLLEPAKGPLPPPTLLQAAYATIVSTLQDEAGPAFDQDYVRGQVDYQKANAALYQYEIANGSDADLVPFARETLPKIQDHLAKALALEQDAGH